MTSHLLLSAGGFLEVAQEIRWDGIAGALAWIRSSQALSKSFFEKYA